MTHVRFSVFTSTTPVRLTKQWKLNETGHPEKISGGQMVEGHAKVVGVANVDQFATLLQTLKPSQALAYGIPPVAEGPVMTRQAWLSAGKPATAICRTKERMSWPDGPGVLFLDYDAKDPGKTLSRDELVGVVEQLCPALAECGLVHWVSSSSYIFREDTGEQVRGLSGQRLYYLVENAIDIPEAGERLQTLLWAQGHGHVEISVAGSLLPKTVLDSSVWQTNRLDFASGADCVPPLVQRRGAPYVRPGRLVRLLSDIPKPPAAIEQGARLAMDRARTSAAPEAAKIKEAHISHLAASMAGGNASPDEVNAARETIRRAVDGGLLAGDFRIPVVENGDVVLVPTREILDNPAKFHGADTLDPVEPSYDDGRPVGRLYLIGGSPRLHSFAHGGRMFKLVRNPALIEVVVGREGYIDECVLTAMRKSQEFYEQSGMLVQLDGKEMMPVTPHSLLFWMRGNCTFYTRVLGKNGVTADMLIPASFQTAGVLLAIGQQRRIPGLRAIVTAQTISPSGMIICESGYNPETRLLLCVDEENILAVPDAPTLDDAKAACERIMHPFRLFPFVGPQDRAIMLAAILSAVVRTAVETCPAFGFDAPIFGSGKTLLAKCVHAIATGFKACVTPNVGGGGEEEIRKRILSILLAGKLCVVWDNIIGTFNSESMAALLTSGEFSDRFLGKSQTVTAPNNAIWLFTGNNMQLSGDMPRRMFRCRIDPQTEVPFTREFSFDPESYCLQHRHEMVRDALVIIRAWIAAGKPKAQGRTASFEQWDELVRQPIAWLSGFLLDLADPLDAMRDGQAADPESEAWGEFLIALQYTFSGRSFTVREVMDIFNNVEATRHGRAGVPPPSEAEITIHEAITDALSKGVTAKRIGRLFLFRQDRIAGGLHIRRLSKGGKGVEWIVHAENKASDVNQSNPHAEMPLQ